MFSANLIGSNGLCLGNDYNGYVPNFMPGEHDGDYVHLEIDVETGKILNWVPPTNKQLNKVFGCHL